MLARFYRIGDLIEAKGLPGVGEPHVKHVVGKLWEMRMSGRSGIARALYQAASGKRVVVLRVFIKKTQKTPASEIDIALERAKEIK
jgi:phage-related protein